MNKFNVYIPAVALLFMLGQFFNLTAQSEKELLAQLVSEDQDAINALVLYPEETRIAILEASLHPEALIKLESVQSQTSSSFRDLLDKYPRSTQEMIWDLTRYPGLVHSLAMMGEVTRGAVKKVLNEYPQVIHQRAEEAALSHHSLLVKIDQLNMAAEAAFEVLLARYPSKTQAAFRQLIALPEVLTILTDNIRLTVLAGDMYRKEPEWVLHKVDSFHLEVARRQAEEVADWKTSLENDPQALEDLKASAVAYEEEYGYDDAYYDYENDDLYYDNEVENTVVRHYYYYHYPYWFGYPSWYYYPRWRLYPVWYDWGFYFGSSGTCIVVNMPSFYFMNWYFYQPYHHHHWPHLSARFTNHYYGHRAIGTSSINTTVANWKERNREVVTDEWMRDDGRLVERFKEYGRFESAREKYNNTHPQKAQTQRDYLDKNASRYPRLTDKATKDRDRKPAATEPVPRTNKPRVTAPEKNKDTGVNRESPPVRTTPRVNTGKDYHKNTWEKTRTTRPKTQPAPRPKTKSPSGNVSPKSPRTNVPKTKNNPVKRKN